MARYTSFEGRIAELPALRQSVIWGTSWGRESWSSSRPKNWDGNRVFALQAGSKSRMSSVSHLRKLQCDRQIGDIVTRIKYLSPILGSTHITLILLGLFGFTFMQSWLTLAKELATRAELDTLDRLPGPEQLITLSKQSQISYLETDSRELAKSWKKITGQQLDVSSTKIIAESSLWKYGSDRSIRGLCHNVALCYHSIHRMGGESILDAWVKSTAHQLNSHSLAASDTNPVIQLAAINVVQGVVDRTSTRIIKTNDRMEMSFVLTFFQNQGGRKRKVHQVVMDSSLVDDFPNGTGAFDRSQFLRGFRYSTILKLKNLGLNSAFPNLSESELSCTPTVIRDDKTHRIQELDGRVDIFGMQVQVGTCRMLLVAGVLLCFAFSLSQLEHARKLPPGGRRSLLQSRFLGFHVELSSSVLYLTSFLVLPFAGIMSAYIGPFFISVMINGQYIDGAFGPHFDSSSGEIWFVYIAAFSSAYLAVKSAREVRQIVIEAGGTPVIYNYLQNYVYFVVLLAPVFYITLTLDSVFLTGSDSYETWVRFAVLFVHAEVAFLLTRNTTLFPLFPNFYRHFSNAWHKRPENYVAHRVEKQGPILSWLSAKVLSKLF